VRRHFRYCSTHAEPNEPPDERPGPPLPQTRELYIQIDCTARVVQKAGETPPVPLSTNTFRIVHLTFRLLGERDGSSTLLSIRASQEVTPDNRGLSFGRQLNDPFRPVHEAVTLLDAAAQFLPTVVPNRTVGP
jgi:hypothetical protein